MMVSIGFRLIALFQISLNTLSQAYQITNLEVPYNDHNDVSDYSLYDRDSDNHHIGSWKHHKNDDSKYTHLYNYNSEKLTQNYIEGTNNKRSNGYSNDQNNQQNDNSEYSDTEEYPDTTCDSETDEPTDTTCDSDTDEPTDTTCDSDTDEPTDTNCDSDTDEPTDTTCDSDNDESFDTTCDSDAEIPTYMPYETNSYVSPSGLYKRNSYYGDIAPSNDPNVYENVYTSRRVYYSEEQEQTETIYAPISYAPREKYYNKRYLPTGNYGLRIN
ncbi:hypothetical protein AYI68_g6898 [Smittium mucronatum]|uniref:Uncharacterized protein n=1 Tax=Smittium mucronatum TaxID=133383 RepID=A0A1R0GQ63_9FUNG|nr:hypothetical protein AYI68_g6898 [Smittium mucronatum]